MSKNHQNGAAIHRVFCCCKKSSGKMSRVKKFISPQICCKTRKIQKRVYKKGWKNSKETVSKKATFCASSALLQASRARK